MAYQHPDFPAFPSSVYPIHPVRKRPMPRLAVRPSVSTSQPATTVEMPVEDIYAASLEASGNWSRSADAFEIYRWNGVYWEAAENFECVAAAHRWLREHHPKKAKERTAKSCFDTARLVFEKLPESPTRRCIIPCRDGWLELLGGQFRRVAPDRTLGITYAINVELGSLPVGEIYQPHALGSGMFARYLETSLPDLAVRSLVQQYAGYTLLPSSFLNLQIAMVFIGNGGDGKGVLTGLLRRLHRKTCAMNLKSLDGFGAEGLIGATLALVDEGPTRGVIDDDRIKTMISGDSLDINRKHRSILTYSPMAKWIISANEAPRFGSAGQAIERRFLFVPWGASLSAGERIPNLEQRIFEDEARQVLDWVLEGALAVALRQAFDCPAAAWDLKQRAMESMDTVLGWKAFAEPRVEPHFETPKQSIYEDYRNWCADQGQAPVRAETFWSRLLRHLGMSEPQVRGPKKLIQNQRVLTVRIGIHLPPPSTTPEAHPFVD